MSQRSLDIETEPSRMPVGTQGDGGGKGALWKEQRDGFLEVKK